MYSITDPVFPTIFIDTISKLFHDFQGSVWVGGCLTHWLAGRGARHTLGSAGPGSRAQGVPSAGSGLVWKRFPRPSRGQWRGETEVRLESG